jgi:lysophospholipase L1-like esterase
MRKTNQSLARWALITMVGGAGCGAGPSPEPDSAALVIDASASEVPISDVPASEAWVVDASASEPPASDAPTAITDSTDAVAVSSPSGDASTDTASPPGCSDPPAPMIDRQPGALVRQHDHVHVVGDSYVNATWYLPLETMVAGAKDDTGALMSVTWTVNGVPGYAPATVYTNRQAMIFDYDPDFLIVELGRNSVGYPLTQVAADVDQLLNAVLTWKPRIRLAWIGAMWGGELWTQTGALPPTWNNYNDAAVAATNTVIARVCAKYNVPYVDGRSFALQYEPYYNPNKNLTGQSAAGPPNGLTSDGTHPNVNGAQVMSQAMFNALSFSN